MLLKQIENKCTVIFFDFVSPHAERHLINVILSWHGLVSWLWSYFKCMSGGLSHVEMPNQGLCSPCGFGLHPGFPALLKLQQCLIMVVNPQWIPPVSMQVSAAMAASSNTGVLIPIWVFFISLFLLQRTADHLLPCGVSFSMMSLLHVSSVASTLVGPSTRGGAGQCDQLCLVLSHSSPKSKGSPHLYISNSSPMGISCMSMGVQLH